MATQLNPGADPTLVQAAYAAAMANVPKDLSGTFEAMATNYAKTMEIVGASWKEAIKTTGDLAKIATGLFAENRKARRRGINLRNSEGIAELHNMMGDIRRDSLAVGNVSHHAFPNHMVKNPKHDSNKTMKNPNYVEGGTEPEWIVDETDNPTMIRVGDLSREDREKVKLSLQNRKQALEGELDTFEAVADSLGASLEQNLHDVEATNAGGKNNMLKVAALAAYTSPSGKIKEGAYKGYYVLPGLNTDDELEFTLYHPDGNPIQDKNKKDITIRSGEVNGLVVMKNEAIIAGRETLFDNIEVSSQNSQKGTTVDHHLKKSRVDHAKLVENENNLHTSIWAPGYLNNESLGKDLAAIEGGGFTSATIFGTLGNEIQGMMDKGLPIDISGGDDPNALDKGDFANQANYDMVVDAILKKDNDYYDEDVTREIYLDWTDDMTREAWKFGQTQRGTDTDSDDGGFKPLSTDMYYKFGDQSITGGRITKGFEKFNAKKEFETYDGLYTFEHDKNKGWTMTGPSAEDPEVIKTVPTTEGFIADQMGFEEYRDRLGVAKGYEWGAGIEEIDTGDENPFKIEQGDMSDEAYKGRKVSMIKEMFGSDNHMETVAWGSGRQKIKPSEVMEALKMENIYINNAADLKLVLDKVKSDDDYRDKITEKLNSIGKGKWKINIYSKHLHLYLQQMLNNFDPTYQIQATTQTATETTTFADLNE